MIAADGHTHEFVGAIVGVIVGAIVSAKRRGDLPMIGAGAESLGSDMTALRYERVIA